MMHDLYLYLLGVLRNAQFSQPYAKPLAALMVIAAILIVAWVLYSLAKFILAKVIGKIVTKTRSDWDDILLRKKVFSYLAHLIPAFFIYHSCHFASPGGMLLIGEAAGNGTVGMDDYYTFLGPFLLALTKLYFVVVVSAVLSTFLNAVNEIYQSTPYAPHRSIKGYIQLGKIVIYFFAAIVSVSVLIGKDPSVLIAGLGVMAGILLLVFKDTILGFVASIQLSANNMVKIGDWIEMPAHGADGTVTDITLNTVKVQNWDKTITTIPTYALVSESFTNWKGMEESDGRRIKRSVSIDINTIQPWTPAIRENALKYLPVREYLSFRNKEEEASGTTSSDAEPLVTGDPGYTNLGIFRDYLSFYLRSNPLINQEMTLLVRQLQSTEKGLPLEIYFFSREKKWPAYEAVHSGVIEHIFAVAPAFGLMIFQSPAGSDLRRGQ